MISTIQEINIKKLKHFQYFSTQFVMVFFFYFQITSSTGTCALAQQKKPCMLVSEPLATSTPVKKSPSTTCLPPHHSIASHCSNLDDSGYVEQQHLDHCNPGITGEYTTGYDHGYRSDKWLQRTSENLVQTQMTRTWHETSYCEEHQSAWQQQNTWHNHGPTTFPSMAIDQRYQEPMMFYS